MTSEFVVYLRLGIEHIADFRGYDHIMFVVALCAGYEPRHWREVLVLVTAFTVGHSITLGLATFRLIQLNTAVVEFVIPLTILITSVLNIAVSNPAEDDPSKWKRSGTVKYSLALCFGLVHGMGFSNFLRAMLGGGGIALPLFAFNVGLEVGQVAIVLILLVATFMLVRWTRMRRHDWTLVLSGATAGVALILMLEQVTG